MAPILLNLDETELSDYPASAPAVTLHPEQLAYLIHTSGSTGQPKSVAVAHGALSRHIQAAGELYAYTCHDRALHFAAFTFDAAMEQWLAPLCHGAGVVLGFGDWTGDDTAAALAAHDISVLYPPTSHLLHLADALAARPHPFKPRIACVGGEAVSAAALHKIRSVLRPERIINGYGPTETLITPLAWQADDSDWSGYAPIGQAVGERSLYVLDRDLNPLPLGAIGELYIGGPCLARGYHQRPGLSAERFLPDPFAADGSRLYRTGDRVRFRPDGVVEYLGRADQQIKLRGYRIEPGEIEAALRQLPGIRDAYVMLRDDHGRRYLAAYLAQNATEATEQNPEVADDRSTDPATPSLSPAVIQTELSQRLPDYMVPAKIVLLDRLPRTAHGKVDRRRLPVPDVSETSAPQAPTTASERLLLPLWQDLLGRQSLGIRDNFFELGGDSIISIQLVSRARAQGLQFTPKDLFQHQTIESLARVAVHADRQTAAIDAAAQQPASGHAPLLPIQHTFFAQNLPKPHHWNQSLLLQTRQALDLDHLQQALEQLIAHHDSLRLRYRHHDGQWLQYYESTDQPQAIAAGHTRQTGHDGSAASVLDRHPVVTVNDISGIAQQAQRRLNLQHGPLFKAVHIPVDDGSERLLLIGHHLIVDAVSWRILLEDLQSLYQQRQQGQSPHLPAKTASYQAWGRALQRYAESPHLQAQQGYWQAQTANPDPTPAPTWPCDHPQGRAQNRDRVSESLSLDSARTRQLLHDANGAYRTRIQELLLAALARTLGEWTGHADIGIELEGHGREADAQAQATQGINASRHHSNHTALDLSRSIGWFTSLYPVKLSVGRDWAETVKTVKEQLRSVPDNGLGYGVLRYLSDQSGNHEQVAVEGQRHDKPQVTFNYLGQLDSSFDAAALLRPAAEDSGDERDPEAPLGNELEINGEIYQGQLRLQWSYSSQRYQAHTIATLLQRYRTHLNQLLDHCLAAETHLTPSDVPLARLNQAQLDALPVAHRQIEDLYPLSPMQQGILFHALQHGDDDPYFYQRVFSLRGPLNSNGFIAAWQNAIARHPALRSVYWYEDAHAPLQIVCKTRSIDLFEADWRGMPPAERWEMLAQCLRDERAQGFNFAGRRGFALSLIRVEDEAWWLIWSHHHIALDGWSMGLVLRDVMQGYYGKALPAVPAHADYLHWFNGRDQRSALDFWRNSLAGCEEMTPLPLAVDSTGTESSLYEEVEISLPASETQALQAAARRYGVTVSTLLQGAYALLLGRHGGCDAALFGVTVSGRSADLAGIEAMAGLFINTLPLRVELDGRQALSAWLQAIQSQTAAMRDYEFTPLPEIQRLATFGEAKNLFEAILVFENYPLDEVLKQPMQGLKVGLLDDEDGSGLLKHNRGRNNYALSLIAGLDGHLHFTFSGRKARFQPGAMTLLARRFHYLLQQIVAGEPMQLADVRLESASPSVLETDTAWTPAFSNPLAAWQAQVLRQPQALAVRDEQRSLSFIELDLAANRLANALLEQGVASETPVGVLIERSTLLPVSLLAILKIGAVYLPLDTALPEQRLRQLLMDSGADCVVTGHAGVKHLAAYGCRVVNLDTLDWRQLSAEWAPRTLHSQQAAYRIYTSGSTGEPKGVTVSHAALNRYLHGVLQRLALPDDCAMAMVSTPAADLGHTVLFGALCSGRPLYLAAADCVADPDRFARVMSDNRIGALKIVPSHLRGLLQAANPADVLPEYVLILGGEACPWDLLETIRKLKPRCRIINHYGPTETTVGVLTHEPDAVQAGATVPVGSPLPGVHAYLLDADLNPVPADVPGELYIGGAGLARGYHGKPGMTAERFLPNPFRSGERFYRTGDRAICHGGNLVWLGRMDNQVKIRGYRIEPDEIGRILRGLNGVADALVLAEADASDGRLQLLGYVVPERQAALDVPALRAELANKLPEYMVPAHILALDAIPLTANGKVDRRALPKPRQQLRESVAPRNELETQLAAIWQTVLKIDAVGVTDNFFELGGDSILSLQIIARARKQGIKLTPKLLFEKQTIAELADAVGQSKAEANLELKQAEISRYGLSGPLPLSYGQERLWFLAQLQPESTAYHINGGLRLSGQLDLAALKSSFETLTARHDMLRTRFIAVDGKPLQVAEILVPVPLRLIDLTACLNAAVELAAWSAQEAVVPFDFEQGPLWRATLIATGEQRHELWLTLHHLLADGWSVGRLLEEFAELYAAALERRQPRLPTLTISYADYAVWQRQWLAAGEGERQSRYWLKQLGGEQPVLELPFDHARPAVSNGRGAALSFSLSATVSERLKQLAVETSTTPFIVLLAAFQALLHRYSGQTDLRIGIPVANRNRIETEAVVGFFVNTLVLRGDCRGELNFLQLLAQVKQTVLGAQDHPDLPFEHLVELLQPQRSLNRNPLFQVMMNHQKRDMSVLKSLPGLAVERIGRETDAAQFDLSLVTEEDENGSITGNWVYAAELFESETIARLSRHFLSLLEQWLAQPEQLLVNIGLLTAAEQSQLAAWNATPRRYPEGLIHTLISQRAVMQPEAIALAFGEQTLSYAELESRANRLAHYLISQGVGPEIPVGIAIERSFELVVGLLAIVKAGGAYVPLDPDYPADRLAYMIEDSAIGLLLSHGAVWPKLQGICGTQHPKGHKCVPYDLDELDLNGQPDVAPSPRLHPESPAYIIYTSGSTGRPKGAANSHAALANRLHWMQEAYAIGPGDTVLQKTPFSFDVSVWEFFWPLLTGARLAIAEPGAHRDPAELARLMLKHRVGTLHFVPSMLAEFVNQPELPAFPDLKRIVCSGEALPAELQQRVFQRLPGVELDNLYGPTEAAIDVTHWTCREDGGHSVPIGQPIANSQIHILDTHLNPLPAGVAGELYIGGRGLARGYHRRSGLTAERFIPDPFGSGRRLYRTGDRARWRNDGVIEYLGRLDHQIKLRGLRIELGEIEAALMAQQGIAEAAVLLKEGQGGGRLVAYLVADAGEAGHDALLRALRSRLPEYMVPSALVYLDSLPKTANGKLDRKALPEPHWSGREFQAPQTETEQRLADVWQSLLSVERVGRSDNFFVLGGHSLLATRLVALIRTDLGVDLPLRNVFETEDLRQLAERIDQLGAALVGDEVLADMSGWLDELELS